MNCLEYLGNPTTWHKPQKICFHSNVYPLLFISKLCVLIKTRYAQQVKILDLQEISFEQVKRELSTSFLGSHTVYWVKNISEQQEWLTYVSVYDGPHSIIFFINAEKAVMVPSLTVLSLPTGVNSTQVYQIVQFFQDKKINTVFYDRICARYPTLSLDTVCLLMQYQPLIGKNFSLFMEQWLTALIEEKKSLFLLSQYFFAKQSALFFLLLKQMYTEYPAEFWIGYWSDQLWQASHFIWYAQQGNSIEGKKNVSRLPFSFIQKDWRAYTMHELAHAHQYLYELDYALKNGTSYAFFDLFYAKFIYGHFSSTST